MTKLYVNKDRPSVHGLNVAFLEDKYDATFMGTWEHYDFDLPLDVFYIRTPMVVSERLAEKYVGVYSIPNQLCFVDVDDIFNRVIVGVKADNGEIAISRFDGDYYISEDKSVWVDGGGDFFKTNKQNDTYTVHIVDDRYEFEPVGLIEVEDLSPPKPTFFGDFLFNLKRGNLP